MIVQDISEVKKIAKARSRTYLWYTAFSVGKLLDEIRGQHFPQVPPGIEVCAVDRGSLACICDDPGGATIYVHQLLNHSDTPIEVFQSIHKHELLHLVFPPREIEGMTRMHPPEFWEAERVLCPERRIAWEWLWYNLSDCLKRRPRLERLDVLGCWKKVWSRPKSSIEEVRGLFDKSKAPEEEYGW